MCFQVPILPKKYDVASHRQSMVTPTRDNFLTENVNRVEKFINKMTGGTLGQKINATPDYKSLGYSRHQNASPNHCSWSNDIIPESPTVDKFSSVADSSLVGDIICDSEEEYKGAVFGPALHSPAKLKLPPIQTLGDNEKDGVQLRSVEEIRILLFM